MLSVFFLSGNLLVSASVPLNFFFVVGNGPLLCEGLYGLLFIEANVFEDGSVFLELRRSKIWKDCKIGILHYDKKSKKNAGELSIGRIGC